MILDRLVLKNFKRFRNAEILFKDGITGVLGNNGTGKSSLYDYFKTKDEILCWYFQDDMDDMIAIACSIDEQSLSAIEKLHRILHQQLERMLGNKAFYLKFYAELQRLGGESRQRIRLKRHAYQDLLRGIVEQGIREGAFRPVNALLATHILQMALMPATFTSRPVGTPDEMLEEAFSLFLQGVQA